MNRHHAYRLPTAGLIVASIAGSATADTTINADIKFSHRLSPANPWLLPSRGVEVEFWETDSVTANDYIGTAYTDQTGKATHVTTQGDGLFDNFLEVYAYVSAKIPGVAYVRDNSSATPYYFRTPTGTDYSSIGINTNGNVVTQPTTNSTYTGGAFNILAPIEFASRYYETKYSFDIPEVPVRYYQNADDDRGNWNVDGYIRIDKGDWGSWDVIGHEYMHHVATNKGMDASSGGTHTLFGDTIPDGATNAQKLRGTALAWNEGLVTAMYQIAVADGNLRGSFNDQLGSRDYDTWYTDFDALSNEAGSAQVEFEYDLETIQVHTWKTATPIFPTPPVPAPPPPANPVLGQHESAAKSRSLGETHEISVQRALWDFYDGTGEAHTGNEFTGFRRAGRSDKISFGADATWKKAMQGTDGTPNKYFRESWEDVASYLGTNAGKDAAGLAHTKTKQEAVARAGEILEEHNISALPTFGNPDITNPVSIADDTPTLTWTEQANGRADLYRLLIFKSDWALQYDSRNLADGNTDLIRNHDHTVPNASKLPNGLYFWVILSNPDVLQMADLRDNVMGGVANQADWFKYYWSGASAFLVNAVPTPGSFVLIGLGALVISRRGRSA